VFAATTYTGTGAAQNILNSANNTIGTTFRPDFVWGKIRSGADYHVLVNSVVGVDKFLKSNTTDAETTNAQTITAFNSNGYSVGTSTDLNRSTYTFVGWQWKGGGTGVSNTSGSITSTVSVNATAGFSVVTFATTGSAGTVGHGLGVAPKFIIAKNRGASTAWPVYHASIGATNRLVLNTTDASTADTSWNNTAPTSTVFSENLSGSVFNFVAYCWAEVAGFSKFGSYTGNGSTDGPFVYLGFRPRYVMLKVSSTTGDWVVYDTSRNTYNVVDLYLYPNSSAAEGGSGTPRLDILSNGFKLRQSGQDNTSGATYIYAAFAENPFKYSNAR
jgi:hypothetical protein